MYDPSDGGEHIKAFRGDERRRLSAGRRRKLSARTGAWIDGLDQPRLTNCDMYNAAFRRTIPTPHPSSL